MPERPDYYTAIGLEPASPPHVLAGQISGKIGATPPGPARTYLEQARAVLGDPGKRRIYDQRLNDPQAPAWTPSELHNLAMAPAAQHHASGIARFTGAGRQRIITLAAIAAALTLVLVLVTVAVTSSGSGGDGSSSTAADRSSGTTKDSSAPSFRPDLHSAVPGRGDNPRRSAQALRITGSVPLEYKLKEMVDSTYQREYDAWLTTPDRYDMDNNGLGENSILPPDLSLSANDAGLLLVQGRSTANPTHGISLTKQGEFPERTFLLQIKPDGAKSVVDRTDLVKGVVSGTQWTSATARVKVSMGGTCLTFQTAGTDAIPREGWTNIAGTDAGRLCGVDALMLKRDSTKTVYVTVPGSPNLWIAELVPTVSK